MAHQALVVAALPFAGVGAAGAAVAEAVWVAGSVLPPLAAGALLDGAASPFTVVLVGSLVRADGGGSEAVGAGDATGLPNLVRRVCRGLASGG
jgi:hypothetical protein